MPEISWSDIAAHRERLVRIARKRCPSREDAEDVVQEALLRCATFEGLDPQRLGAFLTSVTVRLCADLYRDAARSQRAAAKLDLGDVPHPEDQVLRATDAEVLGALLATLPAKQRAVLVDRARGLSVTQICRRHALTYKAAESALSRARVAMRHAIAATMSAVAAAAAIARRRPVSLAALPVATLAVCGTVLHVPWGTGGYRARASAPVVRLESAPRAETSPRATGRTASAAAGAVRAAAGDVRTAVSAPRGSAPAPARHLARLSDDTTGTSTDVYDDGGPPVTVEYLERCVREGVHTEVEVGPDALKGETTCGDSAHQEGTP
jgi:RNA polymerase sigma factor (sigma-70 family)